MGTIGTVKRTAKPAPVPDVDETAERLEEIAERLEEIAEEIADAQEEIRLTSDREEKADYRESIAELKEERTELQAELKSLKPAPAPAKPVKEGRTTVATKPAPKVSAPKVTAKPAPKVSAPKVTAKPAPAKPVKKAPAPAPALKARVKGFKPYDSRVLYEEGVTVKEDRTAPVKGWESGRLDWLAGTFRVIVYSKGRAKPFDLQYPGNTYFRTVSWANGLDAVGFVKELVKLNGLKTMKAGQYRVSIYRNGTCVAVWADGTWEREYHAPAKPAPKVTAKPAPAPTGRTRTTKPAPAKPVAKPAPTGTRSRTAKPAR